MRPRAARPGKVTRCEVCERVARRERTEQVGSALERYQRWITTRGQSGALTRTGVAR